MIPLKEPKPICESQTLTYAQRSRYILLGMAGLTLVGSIAFGYLPRKHQIIVGTGLATGIGILTKLGFDFTEIIKTERYKLGDIETPNGLIGSDPGQGKVLVQLTQQEHKELTAKRSRVQAENYIPKV